MKRSAASLFLFLAILTLASGFRSDKNRPAEGIQWLTIEEAYAKIQQEPRKVLIDVYTDWCGWCKKLVSDTFSQPAFQDYAKENLVLLEIDFPQGKPQSAELKKQNEALSKKYGVNGFPTLVLLNPNGKEIARNEGYLAGGPEAFEKWAEGAK